MNPNQPPITKYETVHDFSILEGFQKTGQGSPIPATLTAPGQGKASLILSGVALAISCAAFTYAFLKAPPSLVPGSFQNATVLVDARGQIVAVVQGAQPTMVLQGAVPAPVSKPFPWSPPTSPAGNSPPLGDTATSSGDVSGSPGLDNEPSKVVENFVKFQSLRFKNGKIDTGWRYADSNATEPESQWCYYASQNAQSKGFEPTLDLKNEVDPGAVRAAGLTHEEYLEAQTKCQWFRNVKPKPVGKTY